MDSDSSENSGTMYSSGCQPAHLKRKRHSSEQNSEDDHDIENLPTNDEKKYKDDGRLHEPSCSFEREGEKRQPFSELKILPGSQDSNIDSLVSDQERLSLSEDVETTSLVSSCDVAHISDLSPDVDTASPCAPTPASSSLTCPYEDMETPILERANPFPPLEWADLPSLWHMMCDCDEDSLRFRNPHMFARHPGLQPRMRAVLIDWISEVCDVYKFHRETFYMTIDYIDRFLSSQNDIPKQQLQLIGITCLQIAVKIEEIYPPKMNEYAYVTDGACTEKEIIDKEVIICNGLSWKLNPVTPIYWLNVFMQISYQGKARHNLGFLYQQYSAKLYTRATHLLNLCTLDIGSLQFSYSVLAATAFYLACNPKLALKVSGLDEEDLAPCLCWMTPFWEVLKQEVPEYSKKYNRLIPGFTKKGVFDDEHNIQKHDTSLSMLELVAAEDARQAPSCLMTPPSSSKKGVLP